MQPLSDSTLWKSKSFKTWKNFVVINMDLLLTCIAMALIPMEIGPFFASQAAISTQTKKKKKNISRSVEENEWKAAFFKWIRYCLDRSGLTVLITWNSNRSINGYFHICFFKLAFTIAGLVRVFLFCLKTTYNRKNKMNVEVSLPEFAMGYLYLDVTWPNQTAW